MSPVGSFPAWYATKMKKKFGFDVAWPPNEPLELGDYGLAISTGFSTSPVFQYEGKLSQLGITFKTLKSPLPLNPAKLETTHVSMKRLTVEAAGMTPAPVGVDVCVNVAFSKQKQMVYHGDNASEIKIKDRANIQRKIEELCIQGRWNPKLVIITRVQSTAGFTLLLTDKKKSSIMLGGSANLTTGNIAQVSANVQCLSNSTGRAEFIVKQDGRKRCNPFLVAEQFDLRRPPPAASIARTQRTCSMSIPYEHGKKISNLTPSDLLKSSTLKSVSFDRGLDISGLNIKKGGASRQLSLPRKSPSGKKSPAHEKPTIVRKKPTITKSPAKYRNMAKGPPKAYKKRARI